MWAASSLDQPSLVPLLDEVQRVAAADAAFGGLMNGGDEQFVISELVGVTSDGLRNLEVDLGLGLGGKAIALSRPVQVRDYCQARGITHHYDLAVRQEKLHSMFAVPVQIPGGAQGAIYGALRHPQLMGDRVIDAVTSCIRHFERTVAVQQEVARRVAALLVPPSTTDVSCDPAHAGAADVGVISAQARLTEMCAELVSLAESMPDGVHRDRVDALLRRFVTGDDAAAPALPAGPQTLTAREREVVTFVAEGMTNKEVADQLSVGAETIKSSLRSSMRKLRARNRVELVAAARRQRMLG